MGILERAGHLTMDDIYNNRILDFAGNIPLIGILKDADASAEKHSRLCGPKLTVYLKDHTSRRAWTLLTK